jgi:cysteine desulfurase
MLAALEDCGNPSSVHGFGRRARQRVEEARGALAALLGAKIENIVFTAGGTEANALMLANRGERRLIVSAIEHDSILKPAAGSATINVDRDGVADLDHLRSLLAADAGPTLVSLMLANNETGVIQPVAEAAAIAHAHGALLHVDAAQAVGRMAVSLEALGADFVTVSGHKFGAPQGVGALIARDTPRIVPLLQGGGQERNRRAGTENVPAIAGLGAAIAALEPTDAAPIASLRDSLQQRLVAAHSSAIVFGAKVPRLPNTLCFAAGDKSAETLVMALDLAGIAISAGSACSSGKVKASHVVTAMGFDRDVASRAIRVSLGRDNTAADVDAFFSAWERIHAPRQMTAAA